MKVMITGASNLKGKRTTNGYVSETFKFGSKSFMKFVNTNAILPVKLRNGYRDRQHVEEIYNLLRIDVDGPKMAKKVDKALRGVTYIKKPSQSNVRDGKKYKWHYLVPTKKIANTYDEYKLQYYKFLSEFGIGDMVDKSLMIPVQNMAPAGKEGIKKTTMNDGKVWVAPKVKVPKKAKIKKKRSVSKKKDVLLALDKIDPDCSYADWLMVGMALYDFCPKRGLKMFDKWSKKSDKYDGTTIDKWEDFGRNISGDVTVGSLMHLAYGDRDEPTSLFKKEKGSVHPLSKKEKAKKKKARKKELKEFDPLKVSGALDDEMMEERKNQRILFESVVVERMHTFIYGAAGSMKTTAIGWIASEIVKEHDDKVIHFWSFDASQNHENSIYNYYKQQGVSDKVSILVGKTKEDYMNHYKMAVELEADLSSLVILIDTWKFISNDINSKGSNKDAMHFIKKLLDLGATVVSLGHTNKDNIKNSGTAEIEQDSDAILRIDRRVDEFSQKVTLTISSAGRARFNCAGVTFKSEPVGSDYAYLYSAIASMKKINEVIDLSSIVDTKIEEVKKEKEIFTKKKTKEIEDQPIIKILKRMIKDINGGGYGSYTLALQSTLEREMATQHISKAVTARVLRAYDGKHWTWKRYKNKSGGKPTAKYELLKKRKKKPYT